MTGVDNKRVFEEVMEVAASPSGGSLSEHLLLVAGRFDRERIFRSVEENGAAGIEYQGQRILLVTPFARERGDMFDTRWLVILNNRIGILGTPWLVQQALRRYADHAVPDSILEERLTLLRPDVTSWTLLVASPRSWKIINFAQPQSAWARLQQDADILLVGARFGAKIRVDFSIHANTERGADFFTEKAAVFTDALSMGPPGEPETHDAPSHHRLENLIIEPNRVQGSVELSSKQFEAWCQNLVRIQGPQLVTAARGN